MIEKQLKQPILTAIILTYNNEKTIEKCIKSLVEQKTEYPYEIHIYDDCSKDGNAEICQRYADLYPEKIKFFPQKENTFLKPYKETQSYKAIQGVNTKYFCIIEGDDYWCDENKVQIGLNFLENNPEYVGWAHDTLQVNEFDGSKASWVHELAKYKIENPVKLDNRFIFLMASSRIFRNCGFKDVEMWPVDYMIYNYHLEKGPIFFYDKIMAVYTCGNNGTFATLGKKAADMNGMFSYKVSCLFDFKHDDICTEMQKMYDKSWGKGLKYYNRLLKFKKIFGIKLGWKLWFIHRFVFKYGFKSMDINYVYDRKKIKKNSDKIFIQSNEENDILNTNLEKLDKMYELYQQNVNDLTLKINYTNSLKEVLFSCQNKLSLDILDKLKNKYSGSDEILMQLLIELIYKLNGKNNKYKRQRKSLTLAVVLLALFGTSLFIVLLVFALWGLK